MSVVELAQFLSIGQRKDLRLAASSNISQLTGSIDGVELVYKDKELLDAVINLINDEEIKVSGDAMRILVNISAEENGSIALLKSEKNIVEELLCCIKDQNYANTDLALGILANITRVPYLCLKVLGRVQASQTDLEGLLFILCQVNYNKKGAKLDLLADVIQNFAQLSEGRREILNPEKCILERLLPFTDYTESKGRRKAAISAIHNCCFEKESHSWLLSDAVCIAERLCLPLAGPSDIFSDDEHESLPLDLQFLPDDKKREEDPDIRMLLLEALMQLCTWRSCRELLREKNIYLILREHHKWEEYPRCVALNEDLVNILIRTEEEIGRDDISAVEVPSEITEKFVAFEDETKTS